MPPDSPPDPDPDSAPDAESGCDPDPTADRDPDEVRGPRESSGPHEVREVRGSDAAALGTLQSYLERPSPGLLQFGLASGSILVTVDGVDEPVGYLLYVRGDATHVAELVVAPARRREGRARALLGALFERVDGRVTVAVAPDNDPALACYRALGFEHDARLPTFYDGEPALRLERSC